MITPQELEALYRQRRSVRRWQDRPVPEELLLKAVELGTWAPNGGNRQPYHFYVVTNKDKIQAMARAVKDAALVIAGWAQGEEAQTAERWVAASDFFRYAPAAVALGAGFYQSLADQLMAARPDDPRARVMMAARQQGSSRLQSAAAAIAQMLLAFETMGLGAVWMTGPLQAKAEIEAILEMDPAFDLVALIPVGYPAEEPQEKPRKPVAEICTVIR